MSRTFKLEKTENGMAIIPNTLGVEAVENRLSERSGGLMHVVAFTDAKAKSKAKKEGMDLIKITDCMCINGLPKQEETTETETTDSRPKWFTRQSYSTITHNTTEEKYLTPHLSNNPKHRAKSYYIDRNTGKIYDKDYLLENEYISNKTYDNANDIKWVMFKFKDIIMIR